MKFTLTYEGQLKPQKKANASHKHQIRKVFHEQLKRLWCLSPLRDMKPYAIGEEKALVTDFAGNPILNGDLKLDWRVSKYGFTFLPIITKNLAMSGAVKIKWLRPEPPGRILQVGDIDNRLKTLFDALQIPPHQEAIPLDESLPELFYCVFEDDVLISDVGVETERLLKVDEQSSDVLLIIDVETKIHRPTLETTCLI